MSKNEPYNLPPHEDKYLTEQEVRAIVSSSMENFSGNFRIKSGSLEAGDTIITPNGITINGLQTGSEIAIQGWQQDMAFSASDADTVAWTSGTITLTDGTTFSIDAGNTGNISATTYIYFSKSDSETVLQTSTTASDAVGSNKILICVAKNSTTQALFQVFGGKGGVKITGVDMENLSLTHDQIAANTIRADEILANTITASEIAANTITASEIAANTITANQIAANTITANEMNVSTLSAISANVGTLTSGTIRGVLIETAASGKRVRLISNELRSYDSSNNLRWHTDGEYTKWLDNNEVEMARSYGWKTGDSYVYTINVGTGTANVGTLNLYGGPNSKNMTLNCQLSMGSNKIINLTTPTSNYDAATKKYVDDNAGSFSCSDLSSCNITSFGNPVYAYSIRAQSGGNYDLGSASYAWNTLHLKNNSSIYWNNTYYLRHNGSTFILNDEFDMNSNRILRVSTPIISTDAANMSYVDNNTANKTLSNLSTTTAINQHLQPGVANSKYCGTSGKFWHRVYSDSYWTKNTTFQTFDKYDDLKIIRDLKFKNNKLVLAGLPNEVAENDFINFGGMTSFNLCVSKKIVETIDDLKDKIKTLENKLK